VCHANLDDEDRPTGAVAEHRAGGDLQHLPVLPQDGLGLCCPTTANSQKNRFSVTAIL
jgi:hypothetical protein